MSNPGSGHNPLRVAIVGSGPSGFYATEALFKSDLTVQVTMLERLPSPFGLVRSGVAPDHQKLKQAIKLYDKIAQNDGFTFLGNVTVGKDLTVDELKQNYHAVIFTCGAESDRKLGIPGEDLKGSHTATEFVGWYNGHPDYRDREFDLSHPNAVIIGQGNVAADVSRILSKTVDELKHTDIAQHALDVLAESRVRDIYVIGRRGPAQAKFTPKELREFGELADCDPIVNPDELELNPASKAELEDKGNAANAKVYQLFRDFSEREPGGKQKRCHFLFLLSPKELVGDDRLQKLVLEKNTLSGDAFSQSARGTGETIELETGILFRSIGYRGVPIPGVPFDDKRGIIPNTDGRVNESGKFMSQLYTAGWIKRGPTGIIGTNRADSVATVNALLEDIQNNGNKDQKAGVEGLITLLQEKNIRYVTYSDWGKIDTAEINAGKKKNKPREKFTRVKEMLGLLD